MITRIFISVFLIFSGCSRLYSQQSMIWLPERCKENKEILCQYLSHCDSLGLNKNDYNADLLELKEISDSIDIDRRITLSALRFFHDVAFGKDAPSLQYNGLNHTPNCLDIPGLFYEALEQQTFGTLLQRIEPASPEYRNIKKLLIRYVGRLSDTTFHPAQVTSYLVDSSNHPLIEQLFQLGFIDSLTYNLPEKVVRTKLELAQHLFGLYEDGGLRPDEFEIINQPLSRRVESLNRALNTFRWLRCLRADQRVVVVNIPAADLFLYENDTTLLSSRIVAGKPATPTSTLASRINEVIMFPYWMVPNSIAVKELLPAIKFNTFFLDAGNFQVLDKSGNIVDPDKINWHALSKKNFPYTLRQANGCDNALGIMKLNFYSPYDVYLHDTPLKNFSSSNMRYASHGCMRVEKAIELACAVLPERSEDIKRLAMVCDAPGNKPVTMRLSAPVPVVVLYQLAWPDENGEIHFYPDVYQHLH